jgi:hypothetical protein
VPFRPTKEKSKHAVDTRAKAILLEPRSVKKANSYQLKELPVSYGI